MPYYCCLTCGKIYYTATPIGRYSYPYNDEEILCDACGGLLEETDATEDAEILDVIEEVA